MIVIWYTKVGDNWYEDTGYFNVCLYSYVKVHQAKWSVSAEELVDPGVGVECYMRFGDTLDGDTLDSYMGSVGWAVAAWWICLSNSGVWRIFWSCSMVRGGFWVCSNWGWAVGGVTTRGGRVCKSCLGPEDRGFAATPEGPEVLGVLEVGRADVERFGRWYRISVKAKHESSSSVEDGTDETLSFDRVTGRLASIYGGVGMVLSLVLTSMFGLSACGGGGDVVRVLDLQCVSLLIWLQSGGAPAVLGRSCWWRCWVVPPLKHTRGRLDPCLGHWRLGRRRRRPRLMKPGRWRVGYNPGLGTPYVLEISSRTWL